jgi:sugar lactone lactonase YvrE
VRELTATPCTTERYELGESCRWDEVRQELSWVDIYGGQFFRATANGTEIDIIRRYDLGGKPSAVAPLESRAEGWILGRDQSIFALDEAGTLRELATPQGQPKDVRMNDGAADPWGRFWIGSMAPKDGQRRANLYRYDDASGVSTILSNVTISNGLAWSADRLTMYYIDSAPGTISAFDVDEEGNPLNGRILVQLDGEKEGSPDGLCLDANGDLWVALFNGYGVRQYSPTGEHLSSVRVDTPQTSCCAIGGANATTLYITTGQERMSDEQRAADPHAGRLFCVDVGVSSAPIGAYRTQR